MVKAVRQHGIVLQTGTQQRSHKLFRLACELARNGRIGKLTQVSVFVPAGLREGPFTPVPVPEGFHWDLWLGQAPQVDYLKERCHSNFRWWFDYSGGPVTDWGAHHNDVARWAIGLDGPTEIQARALIEPIPGGYTTPPQFEATLNWANGVKQVVKTTPDDSPYGAIIKPDGQRNGVKLEGTNGWIWVNRSTIEASDQAMLDTPMENPAVRLEVSDDHMANFFDAVRSAQRPDQSCRSRTPVRRRRTPDRDCAPDGAHAALGHGDGDIRRRGRRGGEHAPGSGAAQAVRLQLRADRARGIRAVGILSENDGFAVAASTSRRHHPRGARCRGRIDQGFEQNVRPRTPNAVLQCSRQTARTLVQFAASFEEELAFRRSRAIQPAVST